MTLAYKVFEKDTGSRLDYYVNWTKFLAAKPALGIPEDFIDSVDWILPTGLTEFVRSNSTKVAFIWIVGAVLGELRLVTCRMTSVGGRIEDQSFYILGVNK